MSSATGIRIDSLLHSLKELQNEKQCLEQKLNERKSRAQALERKVDGCNTKLTQMREMHQKLSEMQKVAMQKVQQTQEQVNSLHEQNQLQSNKISELNELIQGEKDREQKNVERFQDQMSDLSRKLITARKFYKTETLQERIQDVIAKIHLNDEAATADREEMDSLAITMQNLELTPTSCTLGKDIPQEMRQMIWAMLEEEESSVTASLQRLQAEQQEICALLQESTCSSQSTTAELDQSREYQPCDRALAIHECSDTD